MYTFTRFLTQTLQRSCGPVLALSAVIAFVLCGSLAVAQSGAGSIQGTVTDATGAVIPGASINVVNAGTNVVANTKTNGVGFYQVPALFTGNYQVTITAPGMRTYKQSIELLVDQNAVINAVMTAGAVTQQVTVSGDAVQLTTTDNGTINSTLENAKINQLPMNGRNILNLAAAVTPGLGSCAQDANGQCAGGLLGYGMEYVADGVTLQGREFGGGHTGQDQFPDPDSIQEVRLETIGTSAEYSTPATGIITTKSGTNALHGGLFWTARNSYWGIAKQRQSPSNFTAPPYIRNEAGGTIGGPIVIPHLYHGKDKSFFFFAYERYSLAQVGGETTHVFPNSWENGDYSQLKNSGGVLQTLYDPNTTQYNATTGTWTRQTFTQEYGEGPGNPSLCNGNINCIPMNRLSPTANIIYKITPPAADQSINPLVQTNLNASSLTEYRTPTYTFRLDHAFNESNRAYLRFTMTPQTENVLRNQPSNQPATIAATVNGFSYPAGASGYTYYQIDMIPVVAGYTHVFSPTFYAETVASQQWFQEQNNAGGSPLTNFEKAMGLPNNFGEAGFPYIEDIVFPPNGTQFIYGMTQIVSTVDENLTKIAGRHQLQFGGRYRHERFGFRPDMSQDTVRFDGQATGLLDPKTISGNTYTALANTGQLNADFFLGGAYLYSVHLQPPYAHYHDMEFDGYFEDNFHAAKNLTLNLGLRYEAHPALWQKYGLMMSFDMKNDALVLGAPISKLISEGYTTQAIINNDEHDGAKFETAQDAGLPDKLMYDDNTVFEPRVGFAWQPFSGHGTVLRGAYGIYAFQVPIRSAFKSTNGNNPLTASYTQDYTNASQAPDGKKSFLLRSQQSTASPLPGVANNVGYTPVMGTNTTNVVDSSSTTSILPGFTNVTPNSHFPVDLATNVNFTIEQPMKWNSALRVSYVWSHGSNLDQDYYYNNHPSNFVWEMQHGVAVPNGGASVIGTSQANTYSSTATGPYDQTTWGSGGYIVMKTGWSNNNELQVNYQKLYHSGVAWQISYLWQKTLRVGGNWNRDNQIDPYLDYANAGLASFSAVNSVSAMPITPALPPAPPANTPSYAYYHALNRFENYGAIDNSGGPQQQAKFNYVYDLPFGRGKHYFSGVNKLVNELIGGYELAGSGSVQNQYFAVTATNWGPTSKIHLYRHAHRITDCRSGTCLKEYLYWNGYIPPTAIAGNPCAAGLSAVVSGLPSDYQPYQTPMDTSCSAPANGKTVTDTYYGQNYVNINLIGATKPSAIQYQPGPNSSSSATWSGNNPFAKTVLTGPFNYNTDASLFKVFPINERVNLRFNMDVFNLLNYQGYTNPDSTDGTEDMTSSYNSARQVQFTLRLNF
ncbi:MAG TPA: carboxypeptidase-like regulatory domain-containing protein [Terracidiphilus sp.]|nr:carboxypeptidase-like regulatory domain-containing protein [Terracidiphilus sp.]